MLFFQFIIFSQLIQNFYVSPVCSSSRQPCWPPSWLCPRPWRGDWVDSTWRDSSRSLTAAADAATCPGTSSVRPDLATASDSTRSRMSWLPSTSYLSTPGWRLEHPQIADSRSGDSINRLGRGRKWRELDKMFWKFSFNCFVEYLDISFNVTSLDNLHYMMSYRVLEIFQTVHFHQCNCYSHSNQIGSMYLYTGTYESMPCPVSGGTLGLHTPPDLHNHW